MLRGEPHFVDHKHLRVFSSHGSFVKCTVVRSAKVGILDAVGILHAAHSEFDTHSAFVLLSDHSMGICPFPADLVITF